MYQNKLNRQWNPCKICKWGSDNTTQEEFNAHCEKCNELASEWEESNEFKQFQIGVKIAKVSKQVEEYHKLCRLYPVIIMGFPGEVIEKLLSKKEEAVEKGLEIINIESIEDLEKYIDKYFYRQLILCLPHTKEFRDFVYSNRWIMGNCKVFTCFPEMDNKSWKIVQNKFNIMYLDKKSILDLKLDKRFDQLAIKDEEDLGNKLYTMGVFPNLKLDSGFPVII